jgi:hypothetical protein
VGGASKSVARAGGMGEGFDAQQMKLLLVGLGGGALPMFINKCIPNVSYCDLLVHVRVCACACCTHVLSVHVHTHTRVLWPSVHNLQSNFLIHMCVYTAPVDA